MPLLSLSHWLTVHGAVTLLAVMAYVVRARVTRQRRHPTAAIAWVLFILLMPYLALPAFLVFGSRKLARPAPPLLTAVHPSDAAPGDWLSATLAALGQPAAAGYRDLQVHADGPQAWSVLRDMLRGARHRLDVCSFILADDALGQEVLAELAARARAGCTVRLMLDGMGRWMGGRPSLERLRRAGVQVRIFVPPLASPLRGRTNLRNHRKLVVADAGEPGARLWCGGRNLACEYFEGRSGRAAWRDLSFDLGGPLVSQAAALFERDWRFAGGRPAPTPGDLPRAHGGPRAEPSSPAGRSERAAPEPPAAQLVASGPDQPDDTLHALLVSAAHRAERRILLATPYFVPEPEMLQALTLAARRGVDVQLLLPARSNHRLSDLARARSLRALAQAGARVLLRQPMLHGKLAVFDDDLALAGSANLDGRSLFLNFELMLAFRDPAAVERFAAWHAAEARPALPYRLRRPGLLQDTAEGLVLAIGFQL